MSLARVSWRRRTAFPLELRVCLSTCLNCFGFLVLSNEVLYMFQAKVQYIHFDFQVYLSLSIVRHFPTVTLRVWK